MDTRLVIGLVGLGSLAAGAVGGFFGGKTYAEKKAEAYINEELTKAIVPDIHQEEKSEPVPPQPRQVLDPEEEKEFTNYLAAYGGDEDEKVTSVHHIHREVDADDPSSYEEDAVIVTTVDEDGNEIQVYRSRVDLVEEGLIEDDEEQTPETAPSMTRESWRVGVISPDDYRKGIAGHTREQLTYYEADDVIIDSSGVALNDETVIGDALSMFGMYGAPADTVYMRNNEKHLDLEITKVRGAYQEIVLGVPMEEGDDSPRKMRAYHE